MATRLQILCINKSNRTNPHERILYVGGKNADGRNWRLSQTDAIDRILQRKCEFYVNRGGTVVNVIVAESRYGNKYLKTENDSEQPDNLLSLPECV